MAVRAWSLRALNKPLGGCDAAAVRLYLSRTDLSAEHVAFFLLNYVGSVWEMWDFVPADAAQLAALAAELHLDGATMGALIARLAEEEEGLPTSIAPESDGDDAEAEAEAEHMRASMPFACTCTLMQRWSEAASFPATWEATERNTVLRAVAKQGPRPGFKTAAEPVVATWAPTLHAAMSARCLPCAED